MITDIGRRHIARIREALTSAEANRISLNDLINDLEGLLALLLTEADFEWIQELQAECNRLELVNAVIVEQGRSELTDSEATEVIDAVRQLQLMLVQYDN